MASIRKSSFMVPSADTYARSAVHHIGYEPRCTPYWPHFVVWFLISMLPESLVDSVRLNMCIKIRKKGQAKDAKKAQ
jgi:17beta-estradiol 17-dehydrogenase / very-long-chain 3-oxoacyl-CoA reductase